MPFSGSDSNHILPFKILIKFLTLKKDIEFTISFLLGLSTSIYGSILILLYIISCIYHALSPNVKGKKVLRVIDHCNVHALVFATYFPIALLGIKGSFGITMASIIGLISLLGIIFSAIKT